MMARIVGGRRSHHLKWPWMVSKIVVPFEKPLMRFRYREIQKSIANFVNRNLIHIVKVKKNNA